MELDNIKQRTTWNDASASINSNFMKVRQAILALQSEGGGLDEAELEEYLLANGYTKEEWVLAQNALLEERIENLEQGGGSANIEGSEFVDVKDGKISLKIDEQGGLGATEQGLGIVDIPSHLLEGITIDVDSSMSGTSENAVANKTIKKYVDEQVNGLEASVNQTFDDIETSIEQLDSAVSELIATKQAILVSGTNIKTINGQSILGSGDITIVGEQGEKGDKGDKGDAGVTSAEVSVDNKAGLPSATASVENQVLKINFSGLKGEQGNSGFTGAADELEVVNNLTQGGAAAALSAEMGKQLNEVLYGKTESNEEEDEGGSEGADGEIVTLTSADFVQGGIEANGKFNTLSTRIRTERIVVLKGDSFDIVTASTQKWAYELYAKTGGGSYNSGWITSDKTIDITEDGFIAFCICKTDNANITPSELLVFINHNKGEYWPSLSKHITQDDVTEDTYGVVNVDGSTIRGRFLVDISNYKDYRLVLSVASDSNMKVTIHLKSVLTWGISNYDSGWKTAGTVAMVTKDMGADAIYLTLNFLYTSSNSNQPSIEDIKKYITFDIAYDAGDDEGGDATEPSEPVVDRGLVGKVDDLSSSVADIEDTLADMSADIEDLQQQVAEGVEIVNNLTDGGIDKALSAEMGKLIGEVLYGEAKYIDISTLPEQNCSLGSDGWYMQGSAGRHKAVDVKDAESVSIEVKGLQTYVAFVTDAYNPPVANNDSIPFATGYSQRTTIAANTTYEAEVPSDAAWLILTTKDGIGNVIEYGEVKVVMDNGNKGLIGVARDVADIKETTESLYNDIHGVPVIVEQTQDDMTSDDYLSAQGRRGYIQWNVTEYPSWELSVNVPSSSTLKCAIQGSVIAAYGTQVDDSGWINPGKSYTYSSLKAKPSVIYARLVFTDYASGSTIPSYDEIVAQGITFSFKTESRSGLITRMDELEGKISISPNSIIYQGEKVDLSDHGFTYKIIGSLSAGASSRQGSALWGKYFFQFHNTLENIVVYDLEAKQNVQVISMAAISKCHAGSGGFGNEYYDASDAFPLLYVSSMDEMKVYVFRITGEVEAWSITLVQTITIGLDVLKIPNIAIDRESNKIVFFGYTKNSWKEPSGNQSVITSCDIPLLSEGDVTISEFYNVSRLPFIYAQQGAFARFGKLYLSYGNTISDVGAFVIDYKGGVVLTSIDFAKMGNFEPEGFEKYGDKVIMTDQNGNIYELSF